MDAMSVSVTHGDVSERHTKREYVPGNADACLADKNRVFVARDYRETFNAEFADSITRFNDKQTRADRLKGYDLYGDMLAGDQHERPMYSLVIQFGNKDTLGVTDSSFDMDEWRALREADPARASEMVREHLSNDPHMRDMHERQMRVYDRMAKRMQSEYPGIVVCAAAVHGDEPCGTPHLTVDYFCRAGAGVPGSKTNYKNGMDERPSLTKAMGDMGFVKGKGKPTPQQQFQDAVREMLVEEMEHEGFSRQLVGNQEKHLTPAEFVARKEAERDAQRVLVDAAAEAAETVEIARAEAELEAVEAVDDARVEAMVEVQAETAQAKADCVEYERRAKTAKKLAKEAEEKAVDAERRQAEAEKKIADAEATARHAKTDAIIAIQQAVGFGLADYPKDKGFGLDLTVEVARSRITAEADDVRRREQAVAEREVQVQEALDAVDEIPPAQADDSLFVGFVREHFPGVYERVSKMVEDYKKNREKKKAVATDKSRRLGRLGNLDLELNAPGDEQEYG